MLDGETIQDMYRRLKMLSSALTDLGATHADDAWIKRKFMQAYLGVDENKCNTIKGRSDF